MHFGRPMSPRVLTRAAAHSSSFELLHRGRFRLRRSLTLYFVCFVLRLVGDFPAAIASNAAAIEADRKLVSKVIPGSRGLPPRWAGRGA